MSRHREFDTEAALEAVMGVFWRDGFEASSLARLEAASGVARGSLYAAFGDKKGLFLAALGHYERTVMTNKLRILSEASNPLAGLEAFFDDTVRFSLEEGRGLGCLLTNAVTEMAPREPELATALNASQQMVQAAFRDCLERAQQQGMLYAQSSPTALAAFLSTVLFGLRVAARMRANRQQLEDSAAIALAAVHKATVLPVNRLSTEEEENHGMS